MRREGYFNFLTKVDKNRLRLLNMWERGASKAPGPAILESKKGMKLSEEAATGRAGATGKGREGEI